MDLIDRYLGAVRWNLPAAKADDIIAELRDLIAARIEDREEALGRPLNKGELSDLLREFGHPLSVAGEYHGRRALIGPELFPFYWFAIRIVLAVTALIEAIQLSGRIVTSAAPFLQSVMHGWADIFQSLLLNAAWVTLSFAIIERTGWLESYLAKWKPEELPIVAMRVQSGVRIRPRRTWEPVFEIALGLAFLGWWTGVLPIAWFPQDAGARVTPAPIWHGLFWPVAALIAARLLGSIVTLLRPRWKPLRAALILGCTAGTVAIATLLYHADRILVVSTPDAAKTAEIQHGLDKGLSMAVIAVAVLTMWHCAVELWKLWQERPIR